MMIYLLIVNAATFLVYVYDKTIAGRNMRRVPEGFLHTCSLIGGSLGALIAMQLVRHKTKKLKFQMVFWLIVLLQVVGLAYWLAGRSPG
jgi:uncharacterized membrane protein YsdA (DUF1294 family)